MLNHADKLSKTSTCCRNKKQILSRDMVVMFEDVDAWFYKKLLSGDYGSYLQRTKATNANYLEGPDI